jgi:hypothetical protein
MEACEKLIRETRLISDKAIDAKPRLLRRPEDTTAHGSVMPAYEGKNPRQEVRNKRIAPIAARAFAFKPKFLEALDRTNVMTPKKTM